MRNDIIDQAASLRRLFGASVVRAVSIAPGSRSVGCTAVALNLAAALARAGHRVLVVDRTGHEAVAALGMDPHYGIAQVLAGECKLSDAVLAGPLGINVLPAARSVRQPHRDACDWHAALHRLLQALPQRFSVCVVNDVETAPDAVTAARTGVGDTLLVITPDADTITAAYAQIKAWSRHGGHGDYRVVIDRAGSEAAALNIYRNMADATRHFLSARLHYCGFIPDDHALPRAAQAKARSLFPDPASACGRAFQRLAQTVLLAPPVAGGCGAAVG
jgi:flagellar biosynthesis protein FlhG